jgi:hypothetical protein
MVLLDVPLGSPLSHPGHQKRKSDTCFNVMEHDVGLGFQYTKSMAEGGLALDNAVQKLPADKQEAAAVCM